MNTRYFGPVRASIDHDQQRVTMAIAPRHGPPSIQLFDAEVEACMIWAIDTVRADLGEDYVIDVSGVDLAFSDE